jgi:hypothetical protein
MGDQVEGKWVVPNPQIPRTFGMMNLVFGILLFLTGAGYLAMYIVMPTFQKRMAVQLKEQLAAQKANHETKLAELKKKEAAVKAELAELKKKEAAANGKEDAAKTKEETEKAKEAEVAIVEERETFENSPEPDLSAMTDVMGWNIMSDIRLAVYYFSEVVSGMVLNVLMVIAGGGLLGLAEWGRRLSIGVAWAKIVRWVAMTIVTMVVIVPITTEKMDKVFTQVQVQAQAKSGGGAAGTPMVGMGQMMAIMSAVAVVFSALIASIYPAISLWFLTRPPTRAACLQASKPIVPQERPELGEPL